MTTDCSWIYQFSTWKLHAQNMFLPCSVPAVFMCWTGNSMNNLLSYCGLVNERISASEKDLPVKVFVGIRVCVALNQFIVPICQGFVYCNSVVPHCCKNCRLIFTQMMVHSYPKYWLEWNLIFNLERLIKKPWSRFWSNFVCLGNVNWNRFM